MTDAEYVLSLIDETFSEVPQIKAHHERMRKIAAFLASYQVMANGLTEAETNATPSCAGLTVKPRNIWTGGRRPVGCNETVEVQFRDGDTDIDIADAYDWEWSPRSSIADIVAYRVL